MERLRWRRVGGIRRQKRGRSWAERRLTRRPFENHSGAAWVKWSPFGGLERVIRVGVVPLGIAASFFFSRRCLGGEGGGEPFVKRRRARRSSWGAEVRWYRGIRGESRSARSRPGLLSRSSSLRKRRTDPRVSAGLRLGHRFRCWERANFPARGALRLLSGRP